MDVLGDLLDRDRRSDRFVLRTADGRERNYRELLTNAYKAGNALRIRGLRRGARIRIAPVPRLQPVLAFLGAGLLGAATRFDRGPGAIDRIDSDDRPRVVFVPETDEDRFDPPPGTNLVVFGGDPDDPVTTHWEEEMWSENPAFPKTHVDPDDGLLTTGSATHSHRAVLDAAHGVVTRNHVDEDDVVVLRGSLTDPRVVAAGIVAPLLAGAGIALPAESATEARGSLAIPGTDVADVPEPKRLSPDDVPL